MNITIKNNGSLRGELLVPADKSISHRALILSALADGESCVKNLLLSDDVLSTLYCLQELGVKITNEGDSARVYGEGIEGLNEPEDVLNCGNSGTTMRLVAGMVASRPFQTVLTGDASLRRRPMARIIEPLSLMGAVVKGRKGDNMAPLVVWGNRLRGIDYRLPVASAQVKSAVLLAGLGAEGETTIREDKQSRDHTERMLAAMGADIKVKPGIVSLKPGRKLEPCDWQVPGDISSAAFFMVAASIVTGSEILLRNVGINPTRAGIIDVLTRMGASISMENVHQVSGEDIADINIKSSPLKSVVLEGDVIPNIIDEIPVLSVAMAMAHGTSIIKDASELRAKESDRIKMMASNLARLGVKVEELPDGLVINGMGVIPGGNEVHTGGDHRIAMAMAVAGMIAGKEVRIDDFACVNVSFPSFLQAYYKLIN